MKRKVDYHNDIFGPGDDNYGRDKKILSTPKAMTKSKTKQSMSEMCKETIEFGDDYGDNPCTFHCQLPLNHVGYHQEIGIMYDKEYRLIWEPTP